MVARAVHYLSAARVSFIPVNCGAIPDALVENELFGHDRGAYTDARITQIGLIAEAAKGTLFLDEVDRCRCARRRRCSGSSKTARIAASAAVATCTPTSASLPLRMPRSTSCATAAPYAAILYRLMVMSVTMPPLRDRAGDVQLLAAHFIHRFSQQHIAPPLRLTRHSAVISRPTRGLGNVRELENLVHRQFLLADDGGARLSETIEAFTSTAVESARPPGHDFLSGFLRPRRAPSPLSNDRLSRGRSARTRATSPAPREPPGKSGAASLASSRSYGFTRTEFAR